MPETITNNGFRPSSRNWLLHARYVRGESTKCLQHIDELQTRDNNTHQYAYFIQASILADSGRYQDALEKFHMCIRLDPKNIEALKQVAKCLCRQGRYQLALDTLLEADRLSQHDPDTYSALAECASSLGDVSRGVEWARAAVDAGGGERAGSLLAKLLVAAEDMDAALQAYDNALTLYACGADTLTAAGVLQLRIGDPRRAFHLLSEALAHQPSQHAAALGLAALMLQHKDLDAALARLKAALSVHPTCVAAHSNLGLVLLSKKKYIAALTCLQRGVWTAPLSAAACHNLGHVLLVCKRPMSAFCRLATAAAIKPSQPYTVLLIAIALERLHDARADAAYMRAADMDPDDALIRLNLAGRHARAGRFTKAVKEAAVTSQLLCRENNAQLAGSLAMLMTLLKDAGVQTEVTGDVNESNANTEDKEELDPDEV